VQSNSFFTSFTGLCGLPGGHLAKPPYPKHVAPPIKPGKKVVPGQPLRKFSFRDFQLSQKILL
jgi:hypothetical protein